MMSGGSKLTAMDRIDRARITALANGESFTVEMAARLMEAHAAAAVAEVAKERDQLREDVERCAQVGWYGLVEIERKNASQHYGAALALAQNRDRAVCRAEQAQARVAELEAEVESVRGLLQRGLDLNIVEANGGGVDEWENDVTAALAPQTPHAQIHPATTDLVHRFAAALREKLAAAEQKYGYSDNWRADDWLDECRAQLAAHVAKGDPRDVAAYCAFLWHHGASTAPQEKKEVPRG